jgi:hypothetical protein
MLRDVQKWMDVQENKWKLICDKLLVGDERLREDYIILKKIANHPKTMGHTIYLYKFKGIWFIYSHNFFQKMFFFGL